MIRAIGIYLGIGLMAIWLDRGIVWIRDQGASHPEWWTPPAWLEFLLDIGLWPLALIVAVLVGAYLWIGERLGLPHDSASGGKR